MKKPLTPPEKNHLATSTTAVIPMENAAVILVMLLLRIRHVTNVLTGDKPLKY